MYILTTQNYTFLLQQFAVPSLLVGRANCDLWALLSHSQPTCAGIGLSNTQGKAWKNNWRNEFHPQRNRNTIVQTHLFLEAVSSLALWLSGYNWMQSLTAATYSKLVTNKVIIAILIQHLTLLIPIQQP